MTNLFIPISWIKIMLKLENSTKVASNYVKEPNNTTNAFGVLPHPEKDYAYAQTRGLLDPRFFSL